MIRDNKLYIDFDTADRITSAVLFDAYRSIKGQLDDQGEVADMHPEDLKYYTMLLPALKLVLDFYGEKV